MQDEGNQKLEEGLDPQSSRTRGPGRGGGRGQGTQPPQVTTGTGGGGSTPPQGDGRQQPINVSLVRSQRPFTRDQALWVIIRNSTNAISFNKYRDFMDKVMCGELPSEATLPDQLDEETSDQLKKLKKRKSLPFPDVEAYRLLKVATEVFLMVNCGVFLDPDVFTVSGKAGIDFDETEEALRFNRPVSEIEVNDLWTNYLVQVNGDQAIPYLALIRNKLGDIRLTVGDDDDNERGIKCFGILRNKLTNPCLLELIWSYWHEEGMLVQTTNAITRRFQNVRGPGDRDPLANLEIDPLRPLNNFLWGYIQDEQHRLTLPRRAYEYDHHYGLSIYGRAVPVVRSADSRSKFLEAFHNLLHLASNFYKEDDDTTRVADGFPLLNSLRDVHLILSEGAHNQFGDLPSTSRQEMLMEEWLLARPEMREFLPTRVMVAYPEQWMDRVDAMKKLQGWSDTSVIHFRYLGVFGEQVLLSIRFGAWSDEKTIHPEEAANWARYWRPEIQGYLHAYRAATGVDLTIDITDPRTETDRYLPPSVHLRKRLEQQRLGR
ncbi:MAG TPA: hypothetical protein VJH03_02020 [Blastocatellia bacterium]|nr:hypothetical protein [Blastocatellia bacterium]